MSFFVWLLFVGCFALGYLMGYHSGKQQDRFDKPKSLLHS